MDSHHDHAAEKIEGHRRAPIHRRRVRRRRRSRRGRPRQSRLEVPAMSGDDARRIAPMQQTDPLAPRRRLGIRLAQPRLRRRAPPLRRSSIYGHHPLHSYPRSGRIDRPHRVQPSRTDWTVVTNRLLSTTTSTPSACARRMLIQPASGRRTVRFTPHRVGGPRKAAFPKIRATRYRAEPPSR